VTLSPGDLGLEDIAPLQAAGVTDQAIEDAIHVCALFNIIDRIADALGFEILTPEGFAQGADILLKRGYR
jgi:alkylhydroperoxidase family enzyme